MVVIVGFHDVAEVGRGQGPLEFQNLLSWSDIVAHQERDHPVMGAVRVATTTRRLTPRFTTLPIDQAASTLGGDPVPFYVEWVDHESKDDPYWVPYRATEALQRVAVPVLLLGGWYDYFIDQTLRQYETLRARHVPTRLVIGPWTHLTVNQNLALGESLAWLDHHVAADGPAPPRAPVRIFVTGAGSWLDLSDWPGPHIEPEPWYLHSGGRLTAAPPKLDEGSSIIRYDPADPTPSVGGRVMALEGGVQDNTAVEARPDVLVFSTAPLEGPLEIRGRSEVTLHLAADSPHVDLFCRLCDVDPRGVSRNVADRILRRDPMHPEPGRVETVSLPLDSAAHRFRAGHRIRLQVAAGAFPRYARNLGAGEPEATGRSMRVTHQTVYFDRSRPSRMTLPVVRVP
jgi:putative CocE/NonD family hydrolase